MARGSWERCWSGTAAGELCSSVQREVRADFSRRRWVGQSSGFPRSWNRQCCHSSPLSMGLCATALLCAHLSNLFKELICPKLKLVLLSSGLSNWGSLNWLQKCQVGLEAVDVTCLYKVGDRAGVVL